MTSTVLTATHREQEILREVQRAGGSCRVTYLAERLGVSDETIRRNLKALQDRALVRKTHGGVVLSEELTLTELPFQARMQANADAKQRLAATFAEMIEDGDSLFLDIGSTTAYAARALSGHRNLYIVTNSLAVASTLATINGNRVFFAGGELRPHDGGSFGQDAITFIQRFNVRYAVFSAGAINGESGFMLHDIQEADLSRQAAARAQTRIVLADSGKFGRRAPIAVTRPGDIDILVTDARPPAPILEMLERHDISLVLADGASA